MRTIRLTDPQIVATLMDQILRDSSSVTVALVSSFKKQTKLKRQQIQHALKKLGHYSFGVDRLWGKGTKCGL